MKYQFCIRFQNTTINSAASKAVLDCNRIFSEEGYEDYTLSVWDNAYKTRYYCLLFKELFKFFYTLKRGSIVGIQYPLLSVNNVFRFFIKLARLKKVKFFCVVHDLESLRNGGDDDALIQKEISNLNYFDEVIVHNDLMLNWLQQHGFKKKAVSLDVFDYLSENDAIYSNEILDNSVVFAGNLNKSTFIYQVSAIHNWKFNLFGPNFSLDKGKLIKNGEWFGEYGPEQIVGKLNGNFGLIWDGEDIGKCDNILGNYLKYNNPHKFSLYLAAGLPVIAPVNSAIGVLVQKYNLGILIKSLYDLIDIQITGEEYKTQKTNVGNLSAKVTSGYYLKTALKKIEADLCNQK